MTAKEKMTAPIASVGADVEQPLSNKLTNQSIADLPGKGNLQATNNAENTAKSANKKNPDDLETVSMMELYDTAYPPKLPIVDGLLYNGTYLFVGSPKIGKSFFMAQIGYHISKGLPLWGFSVRQGTGKARKCCKTLSNTNNSGVRISRLLHFLVAAWTCVGNQKKNGCDHKTDTRNK